MLLVRECIPEKTVTIRPKDKPWFDSTLRKTIRKRYRLSQYCSKSDSSKYRNIRNQVNNMKKHAPSNYYDNIGIYLHEAHKDTLNSTGSY